ncbi:MAG: PLP-dependent transferase [Vallitaleaceae bacterium]|nr:PLP-dependent transferase [Vallitaleaceae bacterium]
MDPSTLCIHAAQKKHDLTGAICMPIYQSATFTHPSVGSSTGFDYSRLQNPTREHVEEVVCALEHGHDAIAFSTGMAAIMACLELFCSGDHLIASDDLYGGSHRIFTHLKAKKNIELDYVNTSDSLEIEKALRPNTKAIFIETPTNPMMKITDLQAVARIAKEQQLILIVDNTFLTPYFQNPLDLGAHIVIHSGTKFLGGHNDTLAGFLVTSKPDIAEELRYIAKTIGACLSPFDAFLITRGIKTLAVRLERQQKSALTLAHWLEKQEAIEKVWYPGLPTHPGYEVNQKQASGFGSMLSIHVKSPEIACKVLEKVRILQYAESLGGVESLITYPMLQTHADVPEEEREKKGINNRLLRISVGLESVDDLIFDLEQAFHQ